MFKPFQVESGDVNTGASIMVEGVLVGSQGSKQKVELRVEKLNVVTLLITHIFLG